MRTRDAQERENPEPTGTPSLPQGALVSVLTSPKAGSGLGRERIAGLVERLTREDLRVEVGSDVGLAVEQISAQRAAGAPAMVVAAGGDGTLNLVADSVPPETPIVPFPLGTENLVARYYGLLSPTGVADLDTAVETVLRGREIAIDAGMAMFPRRVRGEQPHCRMFLVMASVGFDAEVVRRMHLTRTGHIRRWSYGKPIVAMMRKYRYPPVRVEALAEGGSSTIGNPDPLTVAWALVFNLPRYAAGLAIESAADETDGLLDFCGLTRGSHFHALRYLAGVLSGRHHRWPDVVRRREIGFRLTADRPLAVQLDGDYAGRLPVEIRVQPGRVRLRLPRNATVGRLNESLR